MWYVVENKVGEKHGFVINAQLHLSAYVCKAFAQLQQELRDIFYQSLLQLFFVVFFLDVEKLKVVRTFEDFLRQLTLCRGQSFAKIAYRRTLRLKEFGGNLASNLLRLQPSTATLLT